MIDSEDWSDGGWLDENGEWLDDGWGFSQEETINFFNFMRKKEADINLLKSTNFDGQRPC